MALGRQLERYWGSGSLERGERGAWAHTEELSFPYNCLTSDEICRSPWEELRRKTKDKAWATTPYQTDFPVQCPASSFNLLS